MPEIPADALLADALPADGDFTELANSLRGGFERTLGLVFTHVTVDEVACEVPVSDALWQVYGLVHGGVYASIAESLCSTGAGVNAALRGCSTVGLDNHCAFHRAVRDGTLHGRARPQHKGRRTQVWATEIHDDQGRLVATATVRTLILDEGSSVAGAVLSMPTLPGAAE